MEKGITYVGIDVDRLKLHVAMLVPGARRPMEWEVNPDEADVRRMVRKVIKEASRDVAFCYEAGPAGYALARQLEGMGVRCAVIAPSLTPRKPGDRVKTDRRDAKKLAELFRAGLLTEVWPPTPAQESVRDLCRCLEDVKQDLMRHRHRAGKFLLRRGYVYRDGRAWTQKHDVWLRSLPLTHPADTVVLGNYLLAIAEAETRLGEIEAEIRQYAQAPEYSERVGWLRCFYGVDIITAMTLLTEIHGVERFSSPRRLMAYIGLVPSEKSSGDRTRRSRITKTGNGHLRRILIECAHHYRHAPGVGKTLKARRAGQPGWAIALADRAHQRLHRRYKRMIFRGKPYGKTIVAVARELAGFVWAMLNRPETSTAQAA